jgi:acyl-CoA synthetase (AMP-forming)/AMP-acid ligase II
LTRELTARARALASSSPDQLAIASLGADAVVSEAVSYRHLWLRVEAIATVLLQTDRRGDRVLLMYSSGAEFAAAFLACSVAGRVAVPVMPPASRSQFEKLISIAENSGTVAVLTTRERAQLTAQRTTRAGVTWSVRVVETDTLSEARSALAGLRRGQDKIAEVEICCIGRAGWRL